MMPVDAAKKVIVCFLLFSFTLSSCVRPDDGPSPFDTLTRATEQPESLPQSPVAGPHFALIPDAELVFGPTTAGFDIKAEVAAFGGYLAGYSELVNEEMLSGAAIIERVAREYSVHPRLLLAILQYSAGWVMGDDPDRFPFFIEDDGSEAILFRQLSTIADLLNYGFYARRVGGLPAVATIDGVELILSREVNDATAAVQYALSQLLGYYAWMDAVNLPGLRAAYASLFDDPFAYEIALLPDNLTQPEMALPFAEGEGWFFTSGPHSGWGTGAAWAALDFAPDEEGWGCYETASWVTAVADGPIVRTGDGIVVQDLDGDGEEGTGWTVLYMHIADEGKATLGQDLKTGDRVGHPSCAGGPATGSHLHIARRYNGEWIPADQDIPFILSGWVSRGDGLEYDGTLQKGENVIEAAGFPTDENKVFQ